MKEILEKSGNFVRGKNGNPVCGSGQLFFILMG